jgi:hypothetical protein
MHGARLERVGAIGGILFFIAVLANFFTPETPDVDDPTLKIVRELADDRTGQIASVYLLGLGALFYLVFIAGLWALLRGAEAERGTSTLVLLGGVGTATIILVASAVLYAVVGAAYDHREPGAVRALFELEEVVFLPVGFTLAVFYVGVALSALGNRSLPAWLGWAAAVFAVVFPIALLGLFSKADDGGVLGTVFFIALVLNFIWVLATSIIMLRATPATGPAGAPPTAT